MSAALKAALGVAAVSLTVAVAWGQLTWARRSLPRVWIEPVERRDVVATITARGRLMRPHQRTLRAGGTGRIRAVLVRPGQIVRAGQPVLIVDAVHLRAALDGAIARAQAARSEEARARATHERAEQQAATAGSAALRHEQLVARGLTPEAELASARYDERVARLASTREGERVAEWAARVRAEQARVAEALRAVENATERAPADGLVSEVLVRAGEWVHVGGPQVAPTALLTMADAGLMVETTLEQADVVRLPVGWPATVVIDADSSREWPARVAGVAEAPGGAVTVRLELLNAPASARDGMSCTVRFTAASRARSVAVPNHALLELRGGAGVWTMTRGVITASAVTIGLRGDAYSEVLAGLLPGRVVVTGPYAVLRTMRAGDHVAVASPPARPRQPTLAR